MTAANIDRNQRVNKLADLIRGQRIKFGINRLNAVQNLQLK